MKNQTFYIWLLCCFAVLLPDSAQAQKANANTLIPPGETAKSGAGKSGDVGQALSDLFAQSELFSPKSTFIWGDYQLLSTRGKRPDFTKTIVPMVGLNYERQLALNLGVRLSVSTNWWEEDKALVIAGSERFTELFAYQYWVVSAGLSWHFNIVSDWDPRWDPFVGATIDYRLASATCDCSTEKVKFFSRSAFLGTRYFLKPRFYLSGEFGRLGTGYFKFGFGFKIH